MRNASLTTARVIVAEINAERHDKTAGALKGRGLIPVSTFKRRVSSRLPPARPLHVDEFMKVADSFRLRLPRADERVRAYRGERSGPH